MPGPTRILLIEDDRGIRDTLMDILEEEGYAISCAGSLSELDAWVGGADLALIDVVLPDGSGVAAARRLRRRYPDLDLVFLTSSASLDSAIDAVELGAVRYLQKPCHPARLIEVLAEVVERRSLRFEARHQARRVAVVHDVLRRFLETLDIQETARIGLEAIRRVTGARGVALCRCGEAGYQVTHIGTIGPELTSKLTDSEWLDVTRAVAGGSASEPTVLGAVTDAEVATCFAAVEPKQGRGAAAVFVQHTDPIDDPELVRLLVDQLGAALHQGELHFRLHEAYEQLRATQQNLVEAEKQSAVGRLAAGIAHEIGTPLNIISGRAEVLLARVPDEGPVAHGLQVIRRQIDRITGLVRQLLDYSRAETDPEELKPIRLTAVLAETLPLVETRAMKGKATIVNRVQPETPPVLGAFHPLQQVVLNLVLNAVDANASQILLDAAVGDDGVMLEILVSDDGSGIPPDRLSEIFEPFYTTKGRGHGTGLGLAVVQGIVREHGGTIVAENVPTGGACFRVRLPLAPGAS